MATVDNVKVNHERLTPNTLEVGVQQFSIMISALAIYCQLQKNRLHNIFISILPLFSPLPASQLQPLEAGSIRGWVMKSGREMGQSVLEVSRDLVYLLCRLQVSQILPHFTH